MAGSSTGSSGTNPGVAGTTAGTGGSSAGTGGSAAGTGGSAAGTGGTGGSSAGTGGSSAGTGGSAAGTSGSGGDAAGTGGTGGGEPVSCDSLAPCGGDVVGAFTVVSCMLEITGELDVTSLGLSPTCEMAPAPVTGMMEVAGTFTFNADGKFADNTTTTGSAQWELAEPCLFLSGTTTTCGMISGPLASTGYRNIMCVDNTETKGCTCTGEIDQEGGIGFVDINAETSGNYTTMDNSLVTSAFGNETEYSYCIASNKLAMTLVSVSKTGTVEGSIVLQKN
jgi:hypothetical protein